VPSALLFVPIAVLYASGALEFVERGWMDWRYRLATRPARSDVVVVDIDPRSLEALNVWPWPRGYHATVLEELRAAGARRIGFDIDFSSHSHPDEDRALADATREAGGHVVLPVFHQWQSAGDGSYLVLVEPLPELREHVTLGSINVQPDADGRVRRYSTYREASGRLYPSFVQQLAAGATDAALGEFYIDFGIDTQSIPRLSYVDVLTGSFDRRQVAGRTVIVGATAVEIGDQVAVPVSTVMAGPLLQALAYESMTQGRTLRRVGSGWTLVSVLLLLVALRGAFDSASWPGGLLLVAVLSVLVLATTLFAQHVEPVILDGTPCLLALVGLYASAMVRRIDQQQLRLLLQRLMIRRSDGLMRHVVEHSFDAIVTVGVDRRVETFNRAASEMFGYASSEITGSRIDCLFAGSELTAGWQNPLDLGTRQLVETTGLRKDASAFPVELVMTEIPSSSPPRRVLFMRDITERRLQHEALRHQATHDPLTNLPNRALLHQRVEFALGRASERGRGVAILLLDLDRFKEINDALGHHAGDQLLRQVSLRLQGPIPRRGTLARLGGDEFAVLLPDSGPDEARELARAMIEALRTPFQIDDLSLQIDTSIGITLFPYHGTDVESLLRRADVAMYQAKRGRRGLEVYDPNEDMTDLRHLTLRSELRQAIDRGEMSLVYQPKICAQSGRVVGVEALLRWSHAMHGPIPPDEFIALAEHGGMIRDLTEWVCRTALEQAAVWKRRGICLNVSVNLSARNLLEEDLPETLERLLEGCPVASHQLTLEITESVLMEDPERAMLVVTRLRELGIGISIDDFGTGYSSLGYLMELPAQELKIDKSFVMRMEKDPSSAMIVHSTIDLAHNLGLKVVAEGVESQVIWQVLQDLGCDYGQGYHFSRPLPPEELLALLAASGFVIDDPEPAATTIDPAMLFDEATAIVGEGPRV
jgi:diguanylate cyclase (GGDEF)-like protein/PAS domain S-box-containing protein